MLALQSGKYYWWFSDFKVGKNKSHSCGDVWHQSQGIMVWIELCLVHRPSWFSKGVEACVNCVCFGCWGVTFNKCVFAFGTPRPCQDGVKLLKYFLWSLEVLSQVVVSILRIISKKVRFSVCFAYFFILNKIINLRIHPC